MKTSWDYSNLAEAYLERPNYSGTAIDMMLKAANIKEGEFVCDVGAGVAHLSLELASRKLTVMAVEPNDAMRALGKKRTQGLPSVEWQEGVGEATGQPANSFDMVTFGSSFNVCDMQLALKETARILKPKGWFACMFNNRQLEDPIQSEIENIIKMNVSNYGYGSRRVDQANIIDASGMFGPVVQISSSIIHTCEISACVKAWKSHATLARQAGPNFYQVIKKIEEYLVSLNCKKIKIPYKTNIWMAQTNE
jgi:ubiquinone/menaquinone biosynthesis C-methylase UbiE